MQPGDIFTVEIPPSDGHEQAGSRPAIILQTAAVQDQLPTVLIVPLTSRLTAQGFPGTLLIKRNQQNGLATDSVALAFQLRAIDKRRLTRKIGHIGPHVLEQLREQIKFLLQLH